MQVNHRITECPCVHTTAVVKSVDLDSLLIFYYSLQTSVQFARSLVEAVTGVIDMICSIVAMFG